MTSETKRIVEEALSLSKSQRLALVDVLSESLTQSEAEPQLSEEWQTEIRRRLDEVEQGKVSPIAWEAFEASVQQDLVSE